MKNLIFLFLLLVFNTALIAQNVSGKVLDESGEGLIGASILVKGTTIGAVTDLDGNFNLDYGGAYPFTIEISYTGFTPQEMEINQAVNDLNVRLEEGVLIGQEIVISCLLYTSPSPRDATLSRMPSSA